MAAVCEVCGKHPSFDNSISHSHRRTKRRWSPNIQRVRALVNGAPKRVRTVVVSAQHDPDVRVDRLQDDLTEAVILPSIPRELEPQGYLTLTQVQEFFG